MSTSSTASPAAANAPSGEQMNIVIVGHVDHGKSTIIGRLLADTDSLPEGKLQQIRDLCERTSKPFEYAFLLDALKDEQAQGITIDAARVFFQSARRHYLIIDAPGHIEFLKNMITGASRAEAALLVIDAAEGVRENSRRHGYLLSMLGLRQVAVLVNKMDLVGYRQEVFERIRAEYAAFLRDIGLEARIFLPVSGMEGDHIATTDGSHMPWYEGPTVLEVLDGFETALPDENQPFRMPVQGVYKFTRFGDARRIIAGTIATGRLRVGDEIIFYPSGKRTTVARLEAFPAPENEADLPQEQRAGEAVGFTVTEQVYVTRGDLAARADQPPPHVTTRLRASVFWLAREPLTRRREVLLRVGTAKVRAHLESITRVIDASNLETSEQPDHIGRHDVAECVFQCEQAVALDLHTDLAETGRFVLIDNYEIAGGGIIHESLPDEQSWLRDKVLQRNLKWERSAIERAARAERYCQLATLVLVSGAADSRKKDLAKALETRLFDLGRLTYYVGIGSVLYGVDADLKTPDSDSRTEHRDEHLRRFAEVAHFFLDAGLILIATAIDLTAADLDLIRTVLSGYRVMLVWADGQPSTDAQADLCISAETDIPRAVEQIKTLLGDEGVMFRG